ncbi:MAG: hypothetical protein KGL53_09350 [Elusimicrobia bacterium]|nr:hypothetical protein [Elusimicrobiota bacterium]
MTRRLALLAAALLLLPSAAGAKGKKKRHKLTDAEKLARSKYIAPAPDEGQHFYIFDAKGDPITHDKKKAKKKEGKAAGAAPARHRRMAHAKLEHKKSFEDQDSQAAGQTQGLPPGVDPAAIAAAAAAGKVPGASSTGDGGGE